MQRQVIFRDRQELQGADLMNLQAHVRQTFDDVIADAITDQARYAGLPVTITGTTEVTVGAGRLYTAGRAYVREDEVSRNLFANLAVSTRRIVTVIAFPQDVESGVDARDFLIDIESLQTEPQTVALESWRRCEIDFVAGVESATPIAPALPANAIKVADITLDTAKVASVQMSESTALTSVEQNLADLVALQRLNDRLGGRVDGLQANLLEIGRLQRGKVDLSRFRTAASALSDLQETVNRLEGKVERMRGYQIQIAAAVSGLSEIENQPDGEQFFAFDRFLTADETDDTPVDYDAAVAEGVRFGASQVANGQLTLFNPSEAGVAQVSDNGVIASYTLESGLRTANFGQPSDSAAVSQYQQASWTVNTRKRSRARVRYGDWRYTTRFGLGWDLTRRDDYFRTVSDPEQEIFSFNGELWEVQRVRDGLIFDQYRVRRVWVDNQVERYNERLLTTDTIFGTNVAQTFVPGTSRYIGRVGLNFAQLGADGAVTVVLAYADEGEPDLAGGGLATATLQYSALKVGSPTYFDMPLTLVEPGRRYAIVVITGGDHRLHIESASQVLDGDLLYLQSNERFVLRDANGVPQSLQLDIQFALFNESRLAVRLGDQSLAGGIRDIDLTFGNIAPRNTALWIEMQVGGTWYRLPNSGSDDATAASASDLLATAPTTLPLRVVMQGSQTVMPMIEIGAGSRVILQRPDKTSFKHYSTARTLAVASSLLRVVLEVAEWDAAAHTLNVQIDDLDNVATENSDAMTETVIDAGTGRIRREYTFNLANPTTEYRIVISGSRSAATDPAFFVESRFDYAS